MFVSRYVSTISSICLRHRNLLQFTVSHGLGKNCLETSAPFRIGLSSCLHSGSVDTIKIENIHQEENFSDNEKEKKSYEIISKVNSEITEKSHSRLFAVIHLCGKQFKVTDEDLVVVEGNWPPQIGERIRLDKVLLVGSSDFTLIGRPILSPDLVSVEATVIEKTLSHTKTYFRKKKRKQYMRINFYRMPYTMLRINSIEFNSKVNEIKTAEGLESRII